VGVPAYRLIFFDDDAVKNSAESLPSEEVFIAAIASPTTAHPTNRGQNPPALS